MNQKNRFFKIRNVLIAVLAMNWLVSAMKIAYSFISNCASMRADGIHSLADGASNIIGIIGIWAASQPIDKEHPYGHKKYETFSALGIAFLLTLLIVEIIHDAIGRFHHPVTPQITNESFYIMVFTMAVNFFVIWFEVKKSWELKSDILFSDAMHTKSDIFVSLSVIGTLISIKLGFPMLDTIVALVIAVFIGHAVFDILKDTSSVLCDKAPIVSDKIKDICVEISGVRECHMIRTRGRPDDIHVDLHVVVSPGMHVDKAHEITETIEKKLKERVSGVTDVVVHIEPNGKSK